MSYRPSSLQSETEDLSEDADDIIMALDRKGPKIGCAYYTFATETLSLMEDLLFPSPDCTAALKFQIKPTTLLIPSRLDEIEQDPEDTECYRTQVRPAADFSYDNARSKLIALRIGDDDGPDVVVPADLGGECTSRGNLLRLAAWVDLESKITVGCAGAVLAFLQRRKAVEARMDQGDGMQIGCIEMFSLKNVMCVSFWDCLGLPLMLVVQVCECRYDLQSADIRR